ncbi:hypothetical protein FRB98_008927 [Tulasnella sp. 332]|nr:hypothetical protein FRB98_008927 [Tulasnella sp. 332]
MRFQAQNARIHWLVTAKLWIYIIDWNHLALINGTHTLIDFKERKRPEKSCHFTGFDIVPVHPNLKDLDQDLDKRVDWVYGNFLSAPLPFTDESFDFVHIKGIARGVPEDKEAARILRTGGALEVIEEDIMFPQVKPLRPPNRQQRAKMFRSSEDTVVAPELSWPGSSPPYAESRLEGSSTHNRSQSSSTAIHVPTAGRGVTRPTLKSMSSLHSPFNPRPPNSTTSNNSNSSGQSSSCDHVSTSLPMPWSKAPHITIPDSRAFLHTTVLPIASEADEHAQLERLFEKVFERRFINMTPTSLVPNLLNIHFKRSTASPYVIRYMPPQRKKLKEKHSSRKTSEVVVPDSINCGVGRESITKGSDKASLDTISIPPTIRGKTPADLLNSTVRSFYGAQEFAEVRNATCHGVKESSDEPAMLNELIDESPIDYVSKACRVKDLLATQMGVALHLHRSLRGILACKEAMWEELMLSRGWKSADFDNPRKANAIQQARVDFDALMERYRTAAQRRISLDDAIERGLGWKPPARDSDKFANIHRELFAEVDPAYHTGVDNNYDDSSSASSGDEGVGSDTDCIGKFDSDDEMITGRPFRRIRIFCAFKAEARA